MKTQDEVLREEWEKWCLEKNKISSGMIADYWLYKIKQERERVLEEVREKLPERLHHCDSCGLCDTEIAYDDGFNSCREIVKAIINEVKK